MKVVELLKIDQKVLELLQEHCISVGDVRYIGLYEEYLRITADGGKVGYAVALLSEKYEISERKVYYLIKRLSKECKVIAV